MTMELIKTLPAAEVAYILRRTLGPARCWGDFLADCIRERTDFCGLRLQPVAYVRDHRCRRPVYAASDVRAFVLEARRRQPPTNPSSLMTTDIMIDTMSYSLPPRMRRTAPCKPGAAA